MASNNFIRASRDWVTGLFIPSVPSATNGNLAAFDENGNLVDSGSTGGDGNVIANDPLVSNKLMIGQGGENVATSEVDYAPASNSISNLSAIEVSSISAKAGDPLLIQDTDGIVVSNAGFLFLLQSSGDMQISAGGILGIGTGADVVTIDDIRIAGDVIDQLDTDTSNIAAIPDDQALSKVQVDALINSNNNPNLIEKGRKFISLGDTGLTGIIDNVVTNDAQIDYDGINQQLCIDFFNLTSLGQIALDVDLTIRKYDMLNGEVIANLYDFSGVGVCSADTGGFLRYFLPKNITFLDPFASYLIPLDPAYQLADLSAQNGINKWELRVVIGSNTGMPTGPKQEVRLVCWQTYTYEPSDVIVIIDYEYYSES